MTEKDGEPAWTELRTHIYREEPAEAILHVRVRGEMTLEDVPLFADLFQRVSRGGRDPIFVLGDISEMGVVSSETRRRFSEALLAVPFGATSVYGASFAQRVITTLADKAINFMRGARRYETRFFATEQQARAWLTQQRLALAKASDDAGSQNA